MVSTCAYSFVNKYDALNPILPRTLSNNVKPIDGSKPIIPSVDSNVCSKAPSVAIPPTIMVVFSVLRNVPLIS